VGSYVVAALKVIHKKRGKIKSPESAVWMKAVVGSRTFLKKPKWFSYQLKLVLKPISLLTQHTNLMIQHGDVQFHWCLTGVTFALISGSQKLLLIQSLSSTNSKPKRVHKKLKHYVKQ